MIKRTTGYTFKGGDVVTPARLNESVEKHTVSATPDSLLGTKSAAAGETESPLEEIPCTAFGRSIIASKDGKDEVFSAMLGVIYPVGSAYINFTDATLPAHIARLGTWEKLHGISIFAADTRETGADADFAAGKTGGAKAVALAKNELPAEPVSIPEKTLEMDKVDGHVHDLFVYNITSGDGSYVDSFGDASYNACIAGERGTTGQSKAYRASNAYGTQIIKTAGEHTPAGKVPAHDSSNLGEGAAHNNMPPYITAHIWRRTA